MRQSRSVLLGTVAAFASLVPAAAMAQVQPDAATAAASPDQVQTIIVTARKRQEDLLKVPVSVSALTSKDITIRDIKTLDDVANFTPGLTDDQASAGGARADRSFQLLVIRGMNPSSTLNPTTSVFINGVPVASSDFLQNLDDTERVEVLKGPQSAYFGRETFAGAINVITKTPVNHLGFDISGEVATRSTFNVSATINVPIIDDKLILRVGGEYDSHNGSYRNAFKPSETLGDQSTLSYHATILARPFENLTIKAYGMYFTDSDGPAATGLYFATGTTPINPATGVGQFDQGNCAIAGSATINFFCGTLPNLNTAVSPAQVTTISQTDPKFTFGALAGFVANPGGIVHGVALVHGFGLKREAYHGDIDVDYAIPTIGVTLTYLGGYNHNNWSSLSDLANVDGAANGQYPGYRGFAFEVQSTARDMSHEFRIATDGTKRFRALLGASYIDAHADSALGVAYVGPGAVIPGGPSRSQTTGLFFSLAYDVFSKLTVNFDGRYQQDKETAFFADGTVSAQGTSKNFLPRASVQYRFVPDVMAYFTYSKGVNPAPFNTQFGTLPASSQATLNALGSAGGVVVKPEKITNYEVGVKGRFFDGRATLSADLYYDKWRDQLNTVTYDFAPADPTNPYNVVGGPQYVPGNISQYPYVYTDNSASSTAKGLEADATFIPIPHVTVNVAGAINITKYDTFNCQGNCLPYASFNAHGKYLPNSPKDSITAGLEYDNAAPMLGPDVTWFARADFIYRDGVYIQSSNTVKTPNVEYVNVRAGFNIGPASIQGFVNNVFNNKKPISGFQDVNFANFSFAPTTVYTGLPQLITGGVKVSFKY